MSPFSPASPTSDESLRKKLIELKWQPLLAHCGAEDMCHGDVLANVYIKTLVPVGAYQLK